jgi:putative ABC transport system substrate-binding protein
MILDKIKNAIGLFILLTVVLSCKGKVTQNSENNVSDATIYYDFYKDSKEYRILILDSEDNDPYKSARISMLDVLRDHGLIEGKNLIIYYASIGNDLNTGKMLLQKYLSYNPDIIVTNGTVMTNAAKAMYFKSKIYKFIYACVTDPVGLGVINVLGEAPAWNFTGVSYPVSVEARLKFIKQLLPKAKRFGLIYADMHQSKSYKIWIENILLNSTELNYMKIIFKKVPLIKGERGAEAMAKLSIPQIINLNNNVDAFICSNDQMGVSKAFVKTLSKYAKKPIIGLDRNGVIQNWGAAASVFPSYKSIGQQVAVMVIKALKGVPFNQLNSEWPKRNGFAFNISKIKKYDLKIPVQLIELAGNNIID